MDTCLTTTDMEDSYRGYENCQDKRFDECFMFVYGCKWEGLSMKCEIYVQGFSIKSNEIPLITYLIIKEEGIGITS